MTKKLTAKEKTQENERKEMDYARIYAAVLGNGLTAILPNYTDCMDSIREIFTRWEASRERANQLADAYWKKYPFRSRRRRPPTKRKKAAF